MVRFQNCESTKVEDCPSLYNQLISEKTPAERLLYWSVPTTSSANVQAVRLGNWKALIAAGDNRVQLFDLTKDPGEQHDVATDHPEIVLRMIRPHPNP